MIIKLVLLLTLVFANFWAFRIKNRSISGITWGLTLGALLLLFAPQPWSEFGLYAYMAATLATLIYGLVAKRKSFQQRSTISLMAVATFTFWLWTTMHWHGNTLLMSAFVLLVGFAGIVRQVKLKKELGLLLIFAVDAVLILLEHWLKINA
jgi:hypothetical protein